MITVRMDGPFTSTVSLKFVRGGRIIGRNHFRFDTVKTAGVFVTVVKNAIDAGMIVSQPIIDFSDALENRIKLGTI